MPLCHLHRSYAHTFVISLINLFIQLDQGCRYDLTRSFSLTSESPPAVSQLKVSGLSLLIKESDCKRELLVRLSTCSRNSLPRHSPSVRDSVNSCSLLRRSIWLSHPLHALTGQLCKGEKVGMGLNFSLFLISYTIISAIFHVKH